MGSGWAARWAAALVISSGLASPASAAQAVVVDDLGEPITGALTICRTVGLGQNCEETDLAAEPVAIGLFDLLTLEGPRHGPGRWTGLPADSVLTLPRKAALSVRGLPPETSLSLSLYALDDPTFRSPAHRFELPTTGELMIPSGSWLASLAERGWAPDLQLLTAGPGEAGVLDYRRRPGWSAIVGVFSARSGEPVNGAWVEVRPTPGFGEGSPLRGQTRAGFVPLSGIDFELADATVRHPGLLATRISALSATPGSFAARRVELETGGHLEVTVRLDGAPSASTRCSVRVASDDDREPWREVAGGDTDAAGRFAAGPLASGGYSLRVEPASDEAEAPRSSALEAFWIDEGQTTRVDVDLASTELSGRIRRRGEPAVGYAVSVCRPTTGSDTHLESVGTTSTDDDGAYSLTLWEQGEHFIWVHDAEHRPVDTARVWVSASGAEHDFDLGEQRLEGRVVDADGSPVDGAGVLVQWNGTRMWTTKTDEMGYFALTMNGGGTAVVDAHLDGHASSEKVTVVVPEDGSVTPLLLRLGGREGLRGRVFAHGVAAAGVRVAAFRPSGDEVPDGVGAVVTAADGSFVIPAAAAGRPLRFFLSGPGCPLSMREAVPGENAALELSCAESAGHLLLHLKGEDGRPHTGLEVTLASSRVAVPRSVLSAHLASLGLPAVSTGTGVLVIPALETGGWEVFLAQGANAATIARGEPFGFLARAELVAGATVELEVTTDR